MKALLRQHTQNIQQTPTKPPQLLPSIYLFITLFQNRYPNFYKKYLSNYIPPISYNSIIRQLSTFPSIIMQEVELEKIDNENQEIEIPQSIIVQIFTRLPQPYTLSSSISLDLSTLTDELILNDMIKKLLIDEKSEEMQQGNLQQIMKRVTFDFLAADKLLRGNLKSHLIRYQISTESTIKLQYFIAFEELQEGQTKQVEDWISAIDLLQFSIDNNVGSIVGMYDGSIQVHHQLDNLTQKAENLTFNVHEGPIKDAKAMISPHQNIYYIITGSLDEEIKVSQFNCSSKVKNNWNLESKNDHNGSILTMDINPMLDGKFCSAGSNGDLNIWEIPETFLEDVPQVKLKNNKRKQTNLKKVDFRASQNFSNNESILSSKWATTSQIMLGCSDHSIKCIDVENMSNSRQFLTKDSVTPGLDYSATNNLLVSSHEDGFIRAWDLRSSATSPMTTFKSHARYASCVQFCPRNSNVFSSGAYDGNLNIWDLRSVFPLQTIKAQYDKIFAVQWITQRKIVFGGSSSTLNSFLI